MVICKIKKKSVDIYFVEISSLLCINERQHTTYLTKNLLYLHGFTILHCFPIPCYDIYGASLFLRVYERIKIQSD